MSGIDELPLSTSAYLADTQHLSLPQHGAYLLILMTMWRAKGWIKDDDRVLANICKVSVPKWLKIAPEIRSLLIEKDGKLSQKRLLSESEKAQKKIQKNAENGRAGGVAKSLKTKKPDVATATNSLGGSPSQAPPGRQNGASDDSLLPLGTKDSEQDSGSKKERKSDGTRLPSDWQPSPDEVAYGRAKGLTPDAIERCAEEMRLWAYGNANRQVARKANWSATFKNWMLRDLKTNGGKHGSDRKGRGGFGLIAAELDALIDDDRQDGHHPAGPH